MLTTLYHMILNWLSRLKRNESSDQSPLPSDSLPDSQGSVRPTKPQNLNLPMVEKMIAYEEGFRNKPYYDSEGYLTIGIGHLIDAGKGGSLAGWAKAELASMGMLSDASVSRIFKDDVAYFDKELRRRAPWVNDLDEVRYACLLDMSFQMGVDGLLGFVNTLDMIKRGNYAAAADGMRHSKWYGQTPNRAERRMAQMRTGQWGYVGK